ncbi:DUF2505 domain-containing protein [Amycolatopsis suaedae]|uniref:DUF2505 domain-containing protein n=1 Tax=Amycolatopsis suaedae TaxID=2510978 RepID=A0A4Q7J989_9PSEU|nr:DUF2505 domain-containing protein [Amycolatopsis suaedae]RZQ64320.1 DUF2505 domain-containing protein [Amycolatopsis suaedae]
MASRIDHRAQFDRPVADVFQALSEDTVLRARLDLLGGKHGALPEHSKDDNGVRYKLVQGIGAEQLPQAVRTLHSGDLIVHREQQWTRSGEGYAGTATAHVNGVPGEITARTELVSDGEGSVLRTIGEVKVRIPLFGAKLESVIAEQVTKLLEAEAQFTRRWLSEH